MEDRSKNLNGEDNKIKRILQIDKTKEAISNELLLSLSKRNQLFSHSSPCSSVHLEPHPDRYFIAQEFNDHKDDLRRSIEKALARFGFTSIAANDFYQSEKLICKIAALIQSTPFGVYQLTKSKNRNVYLELGIAVGLSKPFILIKDKGADPASIVSDIEYYPINSYLDIQYELGDLLETYITSLGRYKHKEIRNHDLNNNGLIYHGSEELSEITIVLAKQVKKFGYTPLILGKSQEKLFKYLSIEANVEPKFIPTRDEIIQEIQKAKFGIFPIHNTASADSFFALGVSIGLNTPIFPIKEQSANVPSDLLHLPSLEYSSYTNLEGRLDTEFEYWLKTIAK